MVKTICDRCGKEIVNVPKSMKNDFVLITTTDYVTCNEYPRRKIDLCMSCREEFLKWLEIKQTKETLMKD